MKLWIIGIAAVLLLSWQGEAREHLPEPYEWFLHNGMLVAGDRVQSPGDSEFYQCYSPKAYDQMGNDLQHDEDCCDGVPTKEGWHPYHPYDVYEIHRGQLTQDQKVKSPASAERWMCRSYENDGAWYRYAGSQNQCCAGHLWVRY